MDKSIKGTQTEKNILASYLSETQASARYTYYAAAANKEGYFPMVRYSPKRRPMNLPTLKFFSKCWKAVRSPYR